MGPLTLSMILLLLTTFRDYNFGGLYREPLSESIFRKLSETAGPSCPASLLPKASPPELATRTSLISPWGGAAEFCPLSHHLLNLSAQLPLVLWSGPVRTWKAERSSAGWAPSAGVAPAQCKPIAWGLEAIERPGNIPVTQWRIWSYFSQNPSTFISFGFFCPTLNFLSLHPTRTVFLFHCHFMTRRV